MKQQLTTRQKIIDLINADTKLTASDIARKLGVSPQRVAQILTEEGLRVPKYGVGRYRRSPEDRV
jgi:predicted ArsR family transcriptional regulator